MELPRNHLKQALANGEMCLGLWLVMASDIAAEIAGRSGFDWCVIDGEHGPSTLEQIHRQLMALSATDCAPVVRVASPDAVALKRVLDLGAQTVLVPMVETPEQAAAMVAACRYPPQGTRGMGGAAMRASGWGSIEDYPRRAHEETCIIVQIESAAALAAAGEIAAVDGIDAVFIGPADLSGDMGFPGQPQHPDVRSVMDQGISEISKAGKAPGILAAGADDFAHYAALGVRFLGVGVDAPALSRALVDLEKVARGAVGKPD